MATMPDDLKTRLLKDVLKHALTPTVRKMKLDIIGWLLDVTDDTLFHYTFEKLGDSGWQMEITKGDKET